MPVRASDPSMPGTVKKRYAGAELRDLGSHLEIAFTGKPARGVRGALHANGWTPHYSRWRKASTVSAVFEAQDTLQVFYGSPVE